MTELNELNAVVSAATRILTDLGENRVTRADAERELAAVAAEQGLRVRLVEHEEAYDGSVHRDLIIRGPGRPAVSLSVSCGPGLPWALRGVPTPREYDLLEVNGQVIAVDEALSCLDALFDDVRLMRGVVDAALVAQALDEFGLEVTQEELQGAADAYRRAKGLYTAEATTAWMRDHGFTPALLAKHVDQLAAVALLRRHVVGDEVAGWFARRGAEYEVVVAAWATGGAEVADRLRAHPLAAVAAVWRTGDEAGLQQWRAGELPAGFAALATASPGEVVQVEYGEATAYAVVVDRRPAEQDARTTAMIERRLFDDWLAGRRAAARVTWFWGDRRRTDRATSAEATAASATSATSVDADATAHTDATSVDADATAHTDATTATTATANANADADADADTGGGADAGAVTTTETTADALGVML
ncbi:TIGR04500 family putative peptide maturation system protein [Streptosporangiaceae bacterium NEAU-GS5]|nr:TIGR04500 family putative peptide maturation system protein [Streptosporangiaceae bacterium NEAU-GS5]